MLEAQQNEHQVLKIDIRGNITKFAMVIEMAGIFLLFQILTDGVFLSSLNLSNLLLQGCTFSILGIGMVWVMVSGGIDLSAGAVLGFLANFAAVLQTQHNLGTTPTILFTLIIGTLIGCWNGYWIAYRRIPAFIATLAGQLIFKGLTLLIGEGKAQGPVSDSFAQMGRGFLLNSASIIFVVLTMCLFVAYTLKKRLSQKSYGLPVLSVRLESFKIVVVVGLLTLGLKGIRQEIYTSLKQKEDLRETDQEMYDFYRSVLISLDAVGELARRYAVLLMEKAEICDDMARRAELLEMSKICTRVPENPPSSFHEALQSLWITFVLFHSTMEFLPIGRSDQYLYPYYRRDIDNHVITAEQADELVGSWLAKFSERVQLDPQQWEMHLTEQDTQYNGADPERLKGSAASAGYANDESYNFGTSANHWLINMILGGQTRDGKDATNELTYMILKNWSYANYLSVFKSA